MKFNKLIFVMLLAFSCGGEVELKKIQSKHLLGQADSGSTPVRSEVKLDLNVREVMSIIFPNAEDMSPQYEEDDSGMLESYLAYLPGYKGFNDPITKSMKQEDKADEVAEKVMILGKVRDSLFKKAYLARKELATLQLPIYEAHKTEIENLNTELQCHLKIQGTNKRKCYLRPLSDELTKKGLPFFLDETKPCQYQFNRWQRKYSGYEVDSDVPSGEVDQYQLSTARYEDIIKSPVITKCLEISVQIKDLQAKVEKYDELRDEIKTYVGNFLTRVEQSILSQEDRPKYFMIAVTKTDVKAESWSGKPNPYDVNNQEIPCTGACLETKSVINFDFKEKKFEKFQLALQMKENLEIPDDGEGFLEDENPLGEYTVLSPGKGMTDLKLEKVGNNHVLRLSLTGPNYTLTTHKDGLELSVHPIFGVRFSGKTIARYLDGTIRNGVLRIDLDFKK
jgi:hypothetical protein